MKLTQLPSIFAILLVLLMPVSFAIDKGPIDGSNPGDEYNGGTDPFGDFDDGFWGGLDDTVNPDPTSVSTGIGPVSTPATAGDESSDSSPGPDNEPPFESGCASGLFQVVQESEDLVCVSSCSSVGKFRDGDTCINSCSAVGKLVSGNICVNDCPAGQKINGNTCINSCRDVGKFLRGDTCVNECPNFIQANTCVSQCSSNKVINGQECLNECPNGKVLDGRECKNSCPSGKVNIDGVCQDACPSGQKVNGDECVASCSAIGKFNNNGVCVNSCSFHGKLTQQNTCVNSCSSSYEQNGNTCISSCSEVGKFNNNGVCVNSCPSGKLIDGNRCVNSCTSGKKQDGNTCVHECPANKATDGNVCRTTCPGSKVNVGGVCQDSCPSGQEVHGDVCVSSCASVNQVNNNGVCVSSCPSGKLTQQNTCVNSCSSGFIQSDNQCVSSCSEVGKFNNNGECVNSCSFHGKLTQQNRCVNNCAAGFIQDGNMCVSSCSEVGKFKNGDVCVNSCSFHGKLTQQNRCVNNCAAGFIQDGNMCVASCSAIGKFNNNGVCVNSCSFHGKLTQQNRCVNNCAAGFYQDGNTCVSSCKDVGKFRNGDVCVSSCSFHGKLTQQNTCVNSCSNGFFQDGNTCVSSCKDVGKFRNGNECVASCSSVNKLTQQNTCVNSCSDGFLKAGNSCVTSCASVNMFLRGNECVNSCPNFIAGNTCVSSCSRFSEGQQCVNSCSSGNVLEGTVCQSSCNGGRVAQSGVCQSSCNAGFVERSGVCHPNTPPTVSVSSSFTVNENELLTFSVGVSDIDVGQPLTLSAANLPTGSSFSSGVFSWTPTFDQAGVYSVTFTGRDGIVSTPRVVTITVINVNRAPTIMTVPIQRGSEGEFFTFTLSGRDSDGDPLTFTENTLPPGAVFTDSTLSWTPTFDQAGTYTAIFDMNDGDQTVQQTVTIVIADVTTAALTEVQDQTVNEGDVLEFSVPDTHTPTSLPPGATFTAGLFSWLPTFDQAGVYQITFALSTGGDQTMTITVIDVESVPDSVNPTVFEVDEGQLLDFDVIASDPDLDSLTISPDSLPTGATFDGENFVWTPTFDQSGDYVIEFTASDGDLDDAVLVALVVIHVNRPPQIDTLADMVVEVGDSLKFLLTGSDPDGDDVFFDVLDEPSNVVRVGNEISFVPTSNQEGEHTIRYQIGDGEFTDTREVTIQVVESPREDIVLRTVNFPQGDRVVAGEFLTALVNLKNDGNINAHDIVVRAYIMDHGIAMASSRFSIGANNHESRLLHFQVPPDLEPGVYYVGFSVGNGGEKRVKYRELEVI